MKKGKLMGVITVLVLSGSILAWHLITTRYLVTNATQSVTQEAGVSVGYRVSEFELPDLSGQLVPVRKAEKITVLNFWTTWCPPCKEELPDLNRFSEKYKNDVKFLAINLQQAPENVLQFMRQYGYTFTVLSDKDGKIARLYRVSAIPTTIIIDQKGIIRFRKTGTISRNELEADVEGLLEAKD